MPFNVPDDWNAYYYTCHRCGARCHESEGGCECYYMAPPCKICGDFCEEEDADYCEWCGVCSECDEPEREEDPRSKLLPDGSSLICVRCSEVRQTLNG